MSFDSNCCLNGLILNQLLFNKSKFVLPNNIFIDFEEFIKTVRKMFEMNFINIY